MRFTNVTNGDSAPLAGADESAVVKVLDENIGQALARGFKSAEGAGAAYRLSEGQFRRVRRPGWKTSRGWRTTSAAANVVVNPKACLMCRSSVFTSTNVVIDERAACDHCATIASKADPDAEWYSVSEYFRRKGRAYLAA